MMPKKKSEDITWNLKNVLAVATMTFCLHMFLAAQVSTGACALESQKST